MQLIFNSLTGQKEPFHPIVAGEVRMYVCGMTVYDYCHIGHARVMVVFDSIVRFLRSQGLKVTYIRNITDIDDKIIQRAAENGEVFTTLTERFITAMHEDSAALGILPPDQEPRVSTHLNEIVQFVQTLVEKGYAYVGGNGDVFYAVSEFADYGQLSKMRLEDLRAGERVAVDNAKRDPLDFVLWKLAKPGEPAWDSPWGKGRPGWHIECSAMSKCCLGDHFDIHGGGMDLKFPHHENEIAQSEAANGCKFANYWMHNGFINIDNVKMSKSLGNFFIVRDVLQHYPAEVVRYFILSSHYRSPINYSDENLDTAWTALRRLYTALRDTPPVPEAPLHEEWIERFNVAMQDDFNTPEACAVLFELVREINRSKDAELSATLSKLGEILGILQQNPTYFLQDCAKEGEISKDRIEQLIQERATARAAKNWAESDRIRDELIANSITLEDSPQGTIWRRG